MSEENYWTIHSQQGQKYADEVWSVNHPRESSPALRESLVANRRSEERRLTGKRGRGIE